MNFNRFGAVLSVLATGVLLSSGCSRGSSATKQPTPADPAKVMCGGKATLKASGSTAQANAMVLFVDAFKQACPGQDVHYTANGSGVGISEFLSKITDFGGSDSPLSTDQYYRARQRCGSPAWHLPVVLGPIAVTYNINGVSRLVLDGPTTAKIFNGTITTWNDPEIGKLNFDPLPEEPIHVVFRSDESGTTDNFQKYLDVAGGTAWAKGTGKTFNGGIGEGAQGNDGTSAVVKSTEGSITYNEWSFAQRRQLNMASIVTSAGTEPVAISSDSVEKTIGGASITGQGNDLVLDTTSFYDPSLPGAYPIVLVTYEIVCSKYPDDQVGTAVRAFLQSTVGAGQNGLADNGYVPIPPAFKTRLSTALNAIT